jgi:peptidyl-prolyl cis-trans isomerase SurA
MQGLSATDSTGIVKKLVFLGAAILVAAQFVTSCSSVPGSVLARVGGDTVRVSEYEEMFLRTRQQPPHDQADREAFLETYIDYRVKLQEARAQGIDQTEAFRDEMQRYRDQLALTFLYQRDLIEPGVETLYNRRLEEIELQHILIKPSKVGTSQGDTSVAYETAREVHALAMAGEIPFDTLLRRYSEDGSRERTNGRLGWFIAGTSYPELDDMMYATKTGDVLPQPLRTVFGYHIFRVLDRKPSRQRLRPAHILARLDLENPNDTVAAHARLAPVLDSLDRGLATFEELAMRNSEDSLSGAAGGDLGWVNRGTNLEPNFEEALFNLGKGETSRIVRTAFGLHIVKVLDEEPPLPLAEQKDHLRGVYQNERFQTDLRNHLARLRAKYDYAVNTNVVRLILSRLDSTVTTSTPAWERRLQPKDLDAYLFRLSFGNVTVREVIEFSKPDASVQMRPITAGLLDTLCERAADRLVSLKETEDFERDIPAFRRLLREYEESTLITTLEDREIWSKAQSSDAEMKEWFDRNRDAFTWPARVQFAEIFSYAKPVVDELLDSLAAGADFTDIASRRTQRPGYFERKGVWDYVPLDKNTLSQRAVALPIGGVDGPISFENGFSLIKLLDRQPPRRKTWEEARAEVVSIYKEARVDELRRAWLAGLREKFGVEVWRGHLDNAFVSEQ